jgi:indole-3-glycerol phosphate synthase
MEDFAMRAIAINMDVLVEVHNIEELERTLQLRLPMIGINNRNLRTFDVSLETTVELMKEIKEDTLIITESGILTADDVNFMREHNIYSFLVGEAFMRQDDPGKALQDIFGVNK